MSNCSDHNSCVDSAMKEAENICNKNNLRFTDIRKTVLKIIWESHKPIKAYNIFTMQKRHKFNSFMIQNLISIKNVFLLRKFLTIKNLQFSS